MLDKIIPQSIITEITLEGKQSAKAEKLVKFTFANMVDKNNEAYINHLYAVASVFQDEMRYTVGLLHEVLEDTKLTENDLAVLGFRESYIKSIILLTKNQSESYEEHIDKLVKSNDTVALDIKLADLNYNTKDKRLNKLPVEIKNRLLAKYTPAKLKIEERRKELL